MTPPTSQGRRPSPILKWKVKRPARRLDLFLVEQGLGPSRAHIQRLLERGLATVNGRAAKASSPLKEGDQVRVEVPPPVPSELEAEYIPIQVVFADQDVLVVEKPAGLAVHPGAGQRSGTLINGLLARYPDLASLGCGQRPGIVHRLDKGTSGLMMVARNEAAYLNLSRQVKERQIYKRYLALVIGELRPERGRIEAPLGRDPRHRKRIAVVERGRPATTEYRVLERLVAATLVEIIPLTGRTHQIRVHFAAIGHPLLGDPVYGGRSPLLGRQFLHASTLGFRQPSTGQYLEFSSELPAELRGVLQQLRGG
jgi:23S rRNA pseudouridine1911/1915/1917 synthase